MPDQPQIAILGAGPIGLEATLYARFLGYKVTLIERANSVAANVQDWQHVQLFTPFKMNATSLGVAAIQSQLPEWPCPAAGALLTGGEYYEKYLLPLSRTDLIVSALHTDRQVLSIGKPDWLKTEGLGNPDRAETQFQILTRSTAGTEELFTADIVIDTTGTYGNHNWLGAAGIPALGECTAAPHICYRLPDVQGRDRSTFENKHVLVVGAGYSAATAVTQLAELSSTQTTWVTRSSENQTPIARIPDDRLATRDTLAATANQLAAEHSSPVIHHSGTNVTSINYRESTDDFEVTFEGQLAETQILDRVIANVGYHPDSTLYTELQLHQCYATEGPMKLAATLLAQSDSSGDCLDQTTHGPATLLTTEPNFYILGSKSYGRNSNFLLSVGHHQIRDLFTIIGQREDLNLYTTMPEIESL